MHSVIFGELLQECVVFVFCSLIVYEYLERDCYFLEFWWVCKNSYGIIIIHTGENDLVIRCYLV